MKRFLLHLIADMVIVALGFFIASTFHRSSYDMILDQYQLPFVVFLTIFLIISFWLNKYEHNTSVGFFTMLNVYAKSLFYTAGITVLSMYLFQLTYYSRLIIFGTMLAIAILELMWVSIYQAFRMAVLIPEQKEIAHEQAIKQALLNETITEAKPYVEGQGARYRETILEETGTEVLDYLEQQINFDSPHTHIISTTTRFNVLTLPDAYFNTLVNLKLINDVKYINKFLESVNIKLKQNGSFILAVESLCLRKKRILAKHPPILNWFVYRFDSFINRVLPKIPLTKKLYYFFTSAKNRVLSKAEIFGRLYSCGFEVEKEQIVGSLMWITARRVKAPIFDHQPTYGLLIRLKRVGKDGKIIIVYKMRTMHAYSEYLQELVYKLNNLQEGGKLNNDFRVTKWGRFLRSLWLDELPMLYNLVNGDLKIVGVRPLSQHFFSLYTPELQELRKKVKPGLIPPFYAQFPTPKTLEQVMQNEKDYLDAYFRRPFTTDFIYFWRVFYNIIFRHARSQ